MNPSQHLTSPRKVALKISLVYVALALLWIYFSDRLLFFLVADPRILTGLQSVKGVAFAVISGIVLFLLLEKEVEQQATVEKELRENERRLNETQQIARLGSWELDVASNTLWWSAETRRLFGLEPDEEISMQKFIDSIHPEDRRKITGLIGEAISRGGPLQLDYRILLPDNDLRYLHEESRTIYADDRKKAVKRIGSVQDITEQKKWEREREDLIEKLEKSLEEIRRLRGILPLCSYCKKIRDDNGCWEQVDVYIHKHSGADISHGICPECLNKYYLDTLDSPSTQA